MARVERGAELPHTPESMLQAPIKFWAVTMAGRSDTYSSRPESDSIEELSKRLTADLRKHIRALVGPGLFAGFALHDLQLTVLYMLGLVS